MTPAESLRAMMEERCLTSRDVGRLLGVHPCTVRKWLMGMHRIPGPGLDVVRRAKPKRDARTTRPKVKG